VSTENLAKALVAAQEQMPGVDKDQTATVKHDKGSYTYNYVNLDQIIARTRPHLYKHGLAIVQFPASEDGKPALRTTLLHESGESISSTMPLYVAKQNDMQALGSAITYARRYAWAAALGIAVDVDDDGAEAVKPAAPVAAQPLESRRAPTDEEVRAFNSIVLNLIEDGHITEQAVKSAAGHDVPLNELAGQLESADLIALTERLQKYQENLVKA
jgi:hypothetical protein